MVARMMANGVGGADADKLKALIVEFAPELEALGVKVDGFDGRLTALEKGVGGWKLSGQMRFDMFHHKDAGVDKSGWKGNGSQFNRARIFLHKDMANGVSFDARYHKGQFDRYYVTAKDFLGAQGLTATLGQFAVDFEGRDNLYKTTNWHDDDAFFLDGAARGAKLNFRRGGFELEGFYNTGAGNVYADNGGNENYGARIAYYGEKFRLSANAIMFKPNGVTNEDWNYKVYYVSLGFKPLKGFDLAGAYFWEKDISNPVYGTYDDPKAWKIVLDVDQSVLKFTSLRAEYAKMDEGFIVGTGPMCWHADMDYNKWGNKMVLEDTKYFKVEALQKWGAKFQTFERYAEAKQDSGKAKELQLGIGFQYTPNLWFGVDYIKCDGQLFSDKGIAFSTMMPDVEDKVIRFRTILNF